MNDQDSRHVALVNLLLDWADWMRGYTVKTGYPRRSIGLATDGGSASFDDMCAQMDNRVCGVVDSAINDLELPQQSAISHRYLASVFRFPRIDYAETLNTAHEKLLAALIRKGVIF